MEHACPCTVSSSGKTRRSRRDGPDLFGYRLRDAGIFSRISDLLFVRTQMRGSLERSLNLAESMEARGFGRPGRTRMPQPAWTGVERAAVLGGLLLVLGAVLWV